MKSKVELSAMNDIRIAICDDEPVQQQYIENLVMAWARKSGRKVLAC